MTVKWVDVFSGWKRSRAGSIHMVSTSPDLSSVDQGKQRAIEPAASRQRRHPGTHLWSATTTATWHLGTTWILPEQSITRSPKHASSRTTLAVPSSSVRFDLAQRIRLKIRILSAHVQHSLLCRIRSWNRASAYPLRGSASRIR